MFRSAAKQPGSWRPPSAATRSCDWAGNGGMKWAFGFVVYDGLSKEFEAIYPADWAWAL